jgi:hypothetical protein
MRVLAAVVGGAGPWTHSPGAAGGWSWIDEGTDRVRGVRQINPDESGHLVAVRWARELDGERVWAIEDCRGVSGRLEQALIATARRP